MKTWTLNIDFGGLQIPLSVETPGALEPIDDYRAINFMLPGKGRCRAVFFLLPDKNSDDPYAVMPTDQWTVPVRWDDKTMLYVPTLNDDSIVAAMSFILDNGLQDDAFEDEDDIAINNQ